MLGSDLNDHEGKHAQGYEDGYGMRNAKSGKKTFSLGIL